MLRISTPNRAFDIPRWHPDGNYFTPTEERNYKFVTTLKGTKTRFARATDPAKFLELLTSQSIHGHHNNMQVRRELDAVVQEFDPYQKGDGVYYLIGHPDAIIHSEPVMNKPRIFLSVVPGSAAQINEWRNR
ncbi:MAG: hypothetical protein HY007_03565 [Candidatus Sungbacteria bacterium]|nr:hypothetical protein [Candidatus Sungbacteria bacterium]